MNCRIYRKCSNYHPGRGRLFEEGTIISFINFWPQIDTIYFLTETVTYKNLISVIESYFL